MAKKPTMKKVAKKKAKKKPTRRKTKYATKGQGTPEKSTKKTKVHIPEVVDDRFIELNQQRSVFVAEYSIHGNATRAALAAGYSADTARSQGSRLLTIVDIKKSIEMEQKRTEKALGLRKELIVTELLKIAFSNIGEFVRITNKGVVITNTDELPPEVMRSIQQITEKSGDGWFQISVKQYSKLAAIKQLCHIFGWVSIDDGKKPKGGKIIRKALLGKVLDG